MLDPQSEILSALYHRRTDDALQLADRAPALTIWEAAALGRTADIDRLLARDPSLVNAFGADGNQPLGLAAFFGQVDAVRQLLDRGAEVSTAARNFMQVQPLHAAVAARSQPAVELLLAHGADANARQQVGYTPLMGAASGGREDLVDLLIAHGADVRLVSEDGKTAADVARDHGHALLAEKLDRTLATRVSEG